MQLIVIAPIDSTQFQFKLTKQYTNQQIAS